MPLDVVDVGRIIHAILEDALDPDLVVVGLVGLIGRERRRKAVVARIRSREAGRAHRPGPWERLLLRRQRIDAAAAEALRPGRVHEIGLVELIRSVDLPQRPAPFVAAAVPGDVADTVEQQAGLLGLRNRLLEETRAAGHAPVRGRMPGEFAEQGDVLELGLDVADVRLVEGIGDAVDDRPGRLFARAAGRRVDAAVIGRRIQSGSGAGIVKVVVAGLVLVLLDVGFFVLVEEARDPVERTAGLRGEAEFLRIDLVVELIVSLEHGSRILAVEALEEIEVLVQRREVVVSRVVMVRPRAR